MMLTQKGWFGLCPVYIGDLHTGCPLLVERHWSLLPLMMLSEWFFAAIMFVKSWQDPEWEPAWPIKVTGDIEPRPAPGE
ncbi:hypothetical protein [Ancylobacter sp.]|uniref:hypothetical protein n=1 Tax=Ancylobacter sp. TaxID=1872567 RepID=UPI003BA94A02